MAAAKISQSDSKLCPKWQACAIGFGTNDLFFTHRSERQESSVGLCHAALNLQPTNLSVGPVPNFGRASKWSRIGNSLLMHREQVSTMESRN